MLPWTIKYNDIQEQVRDYIGDGCKVRYEAFPSDKGGLPINNLNSVAVKGKAVFESQKFIFSDGIFVDSKINYSSPVIENPTWLEVAKIANEVIITADWKDRIFFNDFWIANSENENQVFQLFIGL